MSLHRKTLSELATGLANREFSSVELTDCFLQRIAAHQPALNALISVTAEQALTAARAADAQRARGAAHFLSGIPLVHKDLFCTDGVLTTCASRMLANFVAPYDATIVDKLKTAGMVMLGKANMDEFAMGSSNENSYFGPVRNPWDTQRVPGGSSGGSAAAVAARLTPVAAGSDTGGSIRQPAAFTGITGIKPTYGRVSRYGMVAFASSLDQAGVFATTAEDAAWVLQTMAGFDPRDSTSVDQSVPDYASTLQASLQGLRIGVVKEFFESGLSASIEQPVREALQLYQKLGAKIQEVSLPHLKYSVPAYYVVAPAECSSNLARFDGVRYGYRCQEPRDLLDLYKRSRGEGFGAEVKRRIMTGTYVLSTGYYDAYYLQAQKVRQLIVQDFQQAFAQVDVLMGPVTPDTAFELGAKTADPLTMYLADIYTIAANLAGIPAMSIPCGFAAGMPVGLQIMGGHFSEGRLLNVAHHFQIETDWHRRIPQGYA
jgi:aspartyl-tRNA(Asn)/glutamyl-tRNA(Gln) amidotransferase subunit A